MSDTDKYPVYLGVWTNWSRGQVFGLTLTLKRQEANLLIAFTAFFIALVSTRFWRIVCFAFHRHYATPSPQNTVYHQRQAILRNSSAAESGMLLLLQLIWANGRNGLGVLLSVVVAAFCVAAFAVAGGLSSQISTAVGTEVLIHSANCGYLDFNKVTAAGSDGDLEGYFALAPVEAEAINNAANYAQQCYSNATAKILDCGRFTKMALPIIVNNKAACPFQEAMCRSNSTNIQIDSGYIDSHEDLGLNSRADHRILARNVLHCAPIRTEGFTSQNNTSLGNLTLYHYGNITVPTGLTDYSFAVESIESQYAIARSPDFPVSGGNYGLASQRVNMKDGEVADTSSFFPIKPIFREDADVALMFLSGQGVFHAAHSNDDWYRISPIPSNETTGNANTAGTNLIYLPLEPASPLGCVEQYQFCYRDTQHCGPLASLWDSVAGAAHIFNTTIANVLENTGNTTSAAEFSYFVSTLKLNSAESVYNVVSKLGPASLASQASLTEALQGPLPSNQWQLDVIRWFEISKAALQASFIDTAYFNPSDQTALKIRSNYTSPDFTSICNNQKIRSTDYASFSLFGLLFAFVVGFLIILTSYLLEPVSEYLYRKWELKTYAHLEWSTNTFLHLQRLAHEELGFGTWSKAMETIPTTEVGDLLGCLDITNPNHPVLLHPSKERDSPEEREDTRGIQGTGVSFDATVSVADEVASLASCYEEIRPSTAAGHEPLLDSNGTSGNSSPVFQHQIETHEELLSSGPSTTRSYPKQNTA